MAEARYAQESNSTIAARRQPDHPPVLKTGPDTQAGVFASRLSIHKVRCRNGAVRAQHVQPFFGKW